MKKIIQFRAFWEGIGVLLTTSCLLCFLYAFMVYKNMEIQNGIPMVATLCLVFLLEILFIRNEFESSNFTNKKNNMKVNQLGQTKGRNRVNIVLNLIVLFLLISKIISKTNSESHQISLVVEMMIWILCAVFSIFWLLIKHRKGDRNWETVFNTKNDITCNTTSQLLQIVLFFVLLTFFIKNFESLYVWIPGIVLGICAGCSFYDDPKNEKRTNVAFFVISAIFCLICAMISMIIQFWSSEIFGVTLWQLLACAVTLIFILIFWAFSELLKNI